MRQTGGLQSSLSLLTFPFRKLLWHEALVALDEGRTG